MTNYELLETPPAYCEPIARLWSWSDNYEYPSPATLFLDLIGWSEEEYGDRLCANKMPAIGYLEAGMLGEALTAYADHPQKVTEFVTALVYSEGER